MPPSEPYPKTSRNATRQLRALLQRVPGLGPREAEDYAAAINNMADKAADLNDIFTRLVEKEPSLEELGELLIAFELTTEQIRGDSDTINGKLYDLGDRLKEATKNGTVGLKEGQAPAKP